MSKCFICGKAEPEQPTNLPFAHQICIEMQIARQEAEKAGEKS